MNNKINKEDSQSKTIKTSDLFEDSFLSITRTFNKLFLADKITTTTAKICLRLFDYFSSEAGRNIKYKNYSITDLRKILGKDNKLLSRSTLKISIEQIQEYNLFLIDTGFQGQELMYSFHPRNLATIELFQKKERGEYFSKFSSSHHFYKSADILSINHLSKDKNQSTVCENESTTIDEKKSISENESAVCENESAVYEVPKTIINTDFETSPKNAQETYIKEYYIKEALHNIEENKILMEQKGNDAMNAFLKKGNDLREEKTNNDNDSTNQKLDTLKNEANQISEIIKSDEKTKESVVNSDKELDELDRIKQILIYDYGFTDASKIIKQYSAKCFNECIDMTIQAEYDNKIKTSAGAYLRTKLKNWEEIIIDHEKVLSNGKNLPPAKKEVKKTYLMGEISFIEFMKSKKYLTHTFNQDINNAVKCMIYNLHYEKANMIEFKELFTKEMIDAFINQVEVTNRFFSTNLNGQWYRDLKFNDEKALFWKAFNNPDLLPEPKILNEKILNDNLFSQIKKKESGKNISEENDDFIP